MGKYIVRQYPKDKKWYLLGYCGGGKWIPVSDPYETRDEAKKWQKHQYAADKAARAELRV